MKRHTGGSDISPENPKTNGLVLKVVVIKVGFCQLPAVNWDGAD
jgi:hypothetical protein